MPRLPYLRRHQKEYRAGGPVYSPLLITTQDSTQVHRATDCTPGAPISLPLVPGLLAESMMHFRLELWPREGSSHLGEIKKAQQTTLLVH